MIRNAPSRRALAPSGRLLQYVDDVAGAVDFNGIPVGFHRTAVLILDLIGLQDLGEFLGYRDIGPVHDGTKSFNPTAPFVQQERQIKLDETFQAIDHAQHQRRNLAFDHGDPVNGLGQLRQFLLLVGDLPIKLAVVHPETLDLIEDKLVLRVQLAGFVGQGLDLALRGARLCVDTLGNGKDVVKGCPAGVYAHGTTESNCRNGGASQNTVSTHSISYAMSG